MSTIISNMLTILDFAKRINNGVLTPIVETLNKTNAMWDDAPWLASSSENSHSFGKRTSLPSGTWRALNQGVARERSHTVMEEEPIGLLEGYSQIDEHEVNSAPDKAQYRAIEDLAFLEGMGQTLASAMVYGNRAVNPNQITGFANRYNALALDNVHSAGGSGTMYSFWIIQWGIDVHLVYPKNDPMLGIRQRDNGLVDVTDANSAKYKAYETQFSVRPGIVVRDDRKVQRVCNIDITKLDAASQKLSIALRNMPNDGAGSVIYAPKELLGYFDVFARDKTNVSYDVNNPFGRQVAMYQGTPVKKMEALVAESAVT